VQIFSRLELDYSRVRSGVPKRVMDLTDHAGNVTNVVFSKDDTQMYTCALDGSCFQWKFEWGAVHGRKCGSFQKGAALMMGLSPLSNTLVVLCEVSLDGAPTAATKKFSSRRGSVMSKSGDDGDDDARPGSRGSRRGSALNKPGHVNSFTMSGFGDGGGARSSARGSMSGLMSPALGGGTDAQENGEEGVKRYLSIWTDGLITDFPKVVHVGAPVTSMAFTASQGPDELHPSEYCFLGLADGTVLISLMPLPCYIVSVDTGVPDLLLPKMPGGPWGGVEGTSRASTAGEGAGGGRGGKEEPKDQEVFDLSRARAMHLHSSAVTVMCPAKSGFWMGTFGADGCSTLISTTKGVAAKDMPEALSLDCRIVMTDKDNLSGMLTKIDDLEHKVTDSKHSNEREMAAIIDKCDRRIESMER